MNNKQLAAISDARADAYRIRAINAEERVAELESKYETMGRMVDAPRKGEAVVVYERAHGDPYVVAFESTGGGEYQWVGPGIRVTNITLLGWTSIAPDKVVTAALEASRPPIG